MTGLRKEIAKHVVLNILETLSEDDFVTIYSFSKTPRPLVKCFSREDDEGMERAELVQVYFSTFYLTYQFILNRSIPAYDINFMNFAARQQMKISS